MNPLIDLSQVLAEGFRRPWAVVPTFLGLAAVPVVLAVYRTACGRACQS